MRGAITIKFSNLLIIITITNRSYNFELNKKRERITSLKEESE
jgi:hypothetical protein